MTVLSTRHNEVTDGHVRDIDLGVSHKDHAIQLDHVIQLGPGSISTQEWTDRRDWTLIGTQVEHEPYTVRSRWLLDLELLPLRVKLEVLAAMLEDLLGELVDGHVTRGVGLDFPDE